MEQYQRIYVPQPQAPGTSLKDQYTARYEDSSKKQGQLQTPAHTVPRRRPANIEPISVDLTKGGDVFTSSSSTVEAFGEPRALWREDSATRKEPLDVKKGRKRKSEELDGESTARSVLPRLSQSSFTAIDAFPEDPEPVTFDAASDFDDTNRTLKHDPAIKEDTFDFEDKPDSSQHLDQSTASPGQSISRSSALHISAAQLPLKIEDMSRSNDRLKLSLSPKLKSSQSSPMKAIADSEDEDDEKPSQPNTLGSETLIRNRNHPTLEITSPSIRISKIVQDEGSPSRPRTERLDSPRKPRAINLSRTNSAASPFQRDSPTKLTDGGKADYRMEVSIPSISTLTGNRVTEAHVKLFLNLPASRTQAFSSQLHQDRLAAIQALNTCWLTEGSPSSEMLQKPSLCVTRIKAMDGLHRLRDEHARFSLQRDESKKKAMAAIESDQDPSSIWAERQLAIQAVGRVEQQIMVFLGEASIPESVWHSSSNVAAESTDLGTNSRRSVPTMLVTSTPATVSATTRVMSKQRPTSSSEPGTTQLVQQTQLHSRDPLTPRKHRSHDSRSPYKSSLRTYTSSPPTKDVAAYFSPRKIPNQSRYSNIGDNDLKSPCSSGRTKDVFSRQTETSFAIESIIETESMFTRNMGSPIRPDHEDDEYGQDDDDEEMLEIAGEYEFGHPKSGPHQASYNRPVFAETTGNVIRTESRISRSAQPPASTAPQQLQYPWSRDVKIAMRQRFHLQGFRPHQLEAINATLGGKDAFVLMPTGGGKSLCYQLPSIVSSGRTRGVTLVISPLLSLMQDQVDHLQKLKIQALFINGEVSQEHRKLVMESLRDPHVEKYIQLLYVTPEMISKSQQIVTAFRDLHCRRLLARIVIDEAHCVSQWGHDFRPDYKMLGEVRRQFQGVPVMALTATATENVKVDVIHNLNLRDCEIFTQSFNRPNLTYEVRHKGKAAELLKSVADLIQSKYQNQSGIIYCLSRQNCEKLAAKLREEYKIKAKHYHAGMDPQDKMKVQKDWQAGHQHVIVATIAFGMGIDKPDVRFVIHHTIPKSLEGYYQETGRAGRDGLRSGCYLYYGYQDTSLLKRMIDEGEGSWEQKERQKQMLRKAIQFCENKTECRRTQILSYFNESFDREVCNGGCDNCSSSSNFESHDFSKNAIEAIELVKGLEEQKVTLLHCVDVYRGSKHKGQQHGWVPQFGAGESLERGHVERIFYRLLSDDALEEYNVVNKAGFPSQYVRVSTT